VIRKDNGSNNSLFLSCQMGRSDGAFFMIKHNPLPNGNHPISSPICPMGVADTLELGCLLKDSGLFILFEENPNPSQHFCYSHSLNFHLSGSTYVARSSLFFALLLV